MNLVLLPGNSADHREWIDGVERVFAPHFENVYTQYYDHWFGGNESAVLDLQSELDKVITQTEDFDPYLIVAKSAGCLLALKGIYEGVLSPHACVFIGLPKAWAQEQDMPIDEWLLSYDTPSLFIQQRQDPVFFGTELAGYLLDLHVTHQMCQILDGASHHYDDIPSLLTATQSFIDFD